MAIYTWPTSKPKKGDKAIAFSSRQLALATNFPKIISPHLHSNSATEWEIGLTETERAMLIDH